MTQHHHSGPGGLRLRPLRLLGTTLAVAVLSACGGKAPETEAARPVIAQPVATADSAQALRFPGEIHARYEMPLSFRIGGQLIARYAHLGDTVKKGQPLARLDDADASKTQASAQAALDAAEHRLVFATQQRDRDEAQARENLISRLQLEQTRDAYAAALASRDQARQQLALSQNQSRYTTLVADRDGSITSEQAEVGQVLAAGQPVFGFAWSGERDVFFDVPEDRLSDVAVGQVATVNVLALSGKPIAARVRDISPAADPQARTYRVKASIDEPGAQLRLGMTADVALAPAANQGKSVRLPATALFHQGEKTAVWVVRAEDSKLELRPVSVLRYGERDVLVSTGLNAGERVVMQGVHTVTAGEKVQPVTPPHPEDAPL
ncbi:RND family efflux transporter, MFP subunit [Dyella sp. OK004]|uniref:efflux RND transporter periplasmic adaptor subunit n=1 Tax=Dyella sp. OK004 TaxID=1855292 RepID=UPI0008ED5B68|nr:efflux RND transporter periplasmic adaptor subunit [Dyella sp. OK004]SFS14425.1 RND family efflux transporter, MFP subunit [Dyella sp. OK004]